MSTYSKTPWSDRVVQYSRRYKDQALTQYTFTEDPGTITNAGTAVTALRMNNMEYGIDGNTGFWLDIIRNHKQNTKTIALFQSDEIWTSGAGTNAVDTANIKLGSQSRRITEDNNSAGTLYIDRNSINIDLSKLNDGSPSSDSDYICVGLYASDATYVASIKIAFSSEATFDGDPKYESITSAGINTGWNFFKISKSSFANTNMSNWEILQSIRLSWVSLANAIDVYVSFQWIALVRDDPSSAAPNMFQNNIDGAWARQLQVVDGEWFLGLEKGELVLRDLDPAEGQSLLGIQPYKTNANLYLKLKIITAGYAYRLGFWVDANNYIRAYINSNVLYLNGAKSGEADITNSVACNVIANDVIEFFLHKRGEHTNVIVYKNYDYTTSYALQLDLADDYNADGYLEYANGTGVYSNILDMSIGLSNRAESANLAETAKSLVGFDNIRRALEMGVDM